MKLKNMIMMAMPPARCRAYGQQNLEADLTETDYQIKQLFIYSLFMQSRCGSGQ